MPRNPNDPNYALLLMGAVRVALLPNTSFAISYPADGGLSQVYIRDSNALALAGKFPAVLLTTRNQVRTPVSARSNEATIQVLVRVLDAWEEDTTTLAGIRARLVADTERMIANLESNPTLSGRTVAYTSIQVGDDQGYFDRETVPAQTCLVMDFAVTYRLLPYDI